MRLHTKLSKNDVQAALAAVKGRGLAGQSVFFQTLAEHRSQTHPHAFEVHLAAYSDYLPEGTVDQNGKRMRVRRNNGSAADSCDDARWAATWDEWGWLMAEIYAFDPDARWGSRYRNLADFNDQTKNKFVPDMLFPKGYSI